MTDALQLSKPRFDTMLQTIYKVMSCTRLELPEGHLCGYTGQKRQLFVLNQLPYFVLIFDESTQEKYKNKPWLLEDETGQSQYQGQLEGAQSATYYLLMMEKKEFVAIPAGSWYAYLCL